MKKLASLCVAVCATAILLLTAPGWGAAVTYADCNPGSLGDDVINCDDDVDGVNALTGNDIITVEAGATVNGPILTLDGGDTITNNGTTTSGIGANGDGTTVTNNGTISAEGTTSFGVVTNGNNGSVINNGTVTVNAADGVGLWTTGSGNTITNNGTIATTSKDTEGIYVQGDNTVVNNGTITTSGDGDSEGIAAYDGNNTVVNTGTITTTDPTAEGIDTAQGGGNDNVTNSGNITTHGGAPGINTGAGEDSVTIQGGAINGLIDGGADTDTLSFEMAVPAADFATLAAALAAASPSGGTITINGNPYTWANFETLHNLLTTISASTPGGTLTVSFSLISDGRLNATDSAAPGALYCASPDGLVIYAISAAGDGVLALEASAAAISAALSSAVSSGAHVQIGVDAASGLALWALSSNELQFMDTAGYVFIFAPDMCGLGA